MYPIQQKYSRFREADEAISSVQEKLESFSCGRKFVYIHIFRFKNSSREKDRSKEDLSWGCQIGSRMYRGDLSYIRNEFKKHVEARLENWDKEKRGDAASSIVIVDYMGRKIFAPGDGQGEIKVKWGSLAKELELEHIPLDPPNIDKKVQSISSACFPEESFNPCNYI